MLIHIYSMTRFNYFLMNHFSTTSHINMHEQAAISSKRAHVFHPSCVSRDHFIFFFNLSIDSMQFCVSYISFRCTSWWFGIFISYIVITPLILIIISRHANLWQYYWLYAPSSPISHPPSNFLLPISSTKFT